MDTKLKKSHKLTTIIITLCILMPAFLLVSLCPAMGRAMQENMERIEKQYKEQEQETIETGWIKSDWILENHFINYAMETGYYVYAQILEERGIVVDFRVLDEYGWDNDFEQIHDSVRYHAKHDNGIDIVEKKNAEILKGDLGSLVLLFDSYGYLQDIILDGEDISFQAEFDEAECRAKAKRSIEQYKGNVAAYEEEHQTEIDETQVMPKNFTIVFAIDSTSDFVHATAEEYISEEEYAYLYYGYDNHLLEAGGWLLILIAVVLVAIMALILPFIRKLETGWEKIFCIPFELVLGFIAAGIFGGYGMFLAMAHTCGIESYPTLYLLGEPISEHTQYVFLLVMNFLGWAMVFFVEYVVVASLRQFLCNPKLYIRNRVLCMRFLCWVKRKCVGLYHSVTNISLKERLNKTVLKIVLANFVLVIVAYSLLYCFVCLIFVGFWFNFEVLFVAWMISALILVGYSIVLYIVLLKYGTKIQKQYHSILQATEQMAEGNLKISLEEDLGVFQPIGDFLNEVQKGFENAVVEEAKSQNMKTELITNVSHDLKTPLTAIITYVDLLKKVDITEEERKSYVQTLDQKSQRLKVLIEDLFEVSKAQSGNVTMNFMDVDIVNLMKQVRMEMEDQIEASNLAFRFNLPEEKIILSLDGQRTYRIFENLLNNALKYAMPHSRVYVDILQNTEEVKVVFRNISAQELDYEPERLTERFVRGDASRNSEGSGLGLAIAKSFTELQGGKFKIEVDGDLFKVLLTWSR